VSGVLLARHGTLGNVSSIFVARRYDETITAFWRISRADHGHLAFLAACYAQLGDTAAS
jgi:hypothetical protein